MSWKQNPSSSFLVPRSSFRRNSGFTLIEVVVTIVILGIITLLATTAFPRVRTNQLLIQSEREIQSLLRIAQQQALDEVRAPDCLAQAGTDKEAARRCSDIGVALQGNRAVTFADTSDANDENLFNESQDFIIAESELAAPVVTAGPNTWQSFVFQASPPDIVLYADGGQISEIAPSQVIISINDTARTLLIYPYGQLERSSQ